MKTVAIVGGGFSGALFAMNLVKQMAGKEKISIHLFEQGIENTTDLTQEIQSCFCAFDGLLETLSLSPNQPQHFVAWLKKQGLFEHGVFYIQHSLYAQYVVDTFKATIAQRSHNIDIFRHEASVEQIQFNPSGGGRLLGEEGISLNADTIVMVTGYNNALEWSENGLLLALLEKGYVVAKERALNLTTTSQFHVFDPHGCIVPGVYALGPLKKTLLEEVSMMAEIQDQAMQLAKIVTTCAEPLTRRETSVSLLQYAQQPLAFDIQALKHFLDHDYSRNLVFKTPHLELLVMCWKPGQGTLMHDHGVSEGVVVVLEGQLYTREVFPDGTERENITQPGEIAFTPQGVSHLMRNNSGRNVVTLHVYAPPLDANAKFLDLPYHNPVEMDPGLAQVLYGLPVMQALISSLEFSEETI